ncbi:MAG: ABC transporter permease [Lachnospiraceae bacterium]|nr:ABC transporter permease [Lachnospiraceae bacterium]
MMEKLYKDFKQNMFAIHQLTERDKKHENAQTFLGELWEILNPLIMTVVMVLVFGKMFDSDSIKNYPLFVLTGVTLYNLFNQGTTACLGALVGNKVLLTKTRLNRNIYVEQKIIYAIRNFVFSLFIYFIYVLMIHQYPSKKWLLVIVDLVFLITLTIGVGKILAVMNVFFADIVYFYRVFTVFLFYGSAIFFDSERLASSIKGIFIINPIYDVVYIAREIILNNGVVAINYWIVLFVYASGFFIAGDIVYKRYSDEVVANL